MAKTFGGLLAGWGLLPIQPPEAGQGVNTFVHAHRQVLTMASQPTTEQPVLARLPAGHVFLFGILYASASLATSVISIGSVLSPAKYRAAAVFTAVDTPTLFGITAAAAASPLSADEDVILTIATAALPAAGTFETIFFTGKP